MFHKPVQILSLYIPPKRAFLIISRLKFALQIDLENDCFY